MGRGFEDSGADTSVPCTSSEAEGAACSAFRGQGLSITELSRFVNTYFDRLNTDGSAGISESELKAGSQNYQGRDKEIVEFLQAARGYLAKLSNDEPGWDDEVGRNDIAALNSGTIQPGKFGAVGAVLGTGVCNYYQQKELVQGLVNQEMREFGLRRFDEIDTSRNGFITNPEMDAALASMSLTGLERALLTRMQAQHKQIGHAIDSTTKTYTHQITTHTSPGVSSAAFIPVKKTSYTLGISRDDLKNYKPDA
jgi:hypothetical protein